MASAPSSAALERKQHLQNILNLNLKVSGMENALYDKDELETLNISVEPFTLAQNGMPTFSPCFFQPFGGDIKEDPYVEEVDDRTKWFPYNEAYDKRPSDWAQITYDFWIHYRFAQGLEYEQRTNFEFPGVECRETDHYRLKLIELNGPVNWFSWCIGHVGELPEQPHFLCLLQTDINGQNDKITRGELLCILEMQEKFYKIPYFKEHIVFPILLISFMGPRHARMLQAHYDGQKLTIHKTELFDFTKDKNVKALTLFTRWSCSSATGDTRAQDHPVPATSTGRIMSPQREIAV